MHDYARGAVITDTQVLSYYYKGTWPRPAIRVRISSATAAEFLRIQSPDATRANYYPILPTRLGHGDLRLRPDGRVDDDRRRPGASAKSSTDQLVLDFGPYGPTFVEFGSAAITALINGRHDVLFAASVRRLDKAMRKKLIMQFAFLLDLEVTCVAVTPPVARVGMNLLGAFLDRYQQKENWRNTINDVLILATAIRETAPLLTHDGLLARFAAEMMGAPLSTPLTGSLLVDFTAQGVSHRRPPLEAKGYIHRGWHIHERRA